MKVIEIQVNVLDVDDDLKYEQDPKYKPQTISLSFEDGDPEGFVHAEADDLAHCITRLVTA